MSSGGASYCSLKKSTLTWSQNVLSWWAGGEGAEKLPIYSHFGQLMLLEEAE